MKRLLIVTFFIVLGGYGVYYFTCYKEFEGFMIFQEEAITFSRKLDLEKRNYWLDFDLVQDSLIRSMYNTAIRINPDSSQFEIRALWIRFEGNEKPFGWFGHMNQYNKKITVKYVISYSAGPVLMAKGD